jgi:hypothetical protein
MFPEWNKYRVEEWKQLRTIPAIHKARDTDSPGAERKSSEDVVMSFFREKLHLLQPEVACNIQKKLDAFAKVTVENVEHVLHADENQKANFSESSTSSAAMLVHQDAIQQSVVSHESSTSSAALPEHQDSIHQQSGVSHELSTSAFMALNQNADQQSNVIIMNTVADNQAVHFNESASSVAATAEENNHCAIHQQHQHLDEMEEAEQFAQDCFRNNSDDESLLSSDLGKTELEHEWATFESRSQSSNSNDIMGSDSSSAFIQSVHQFNSNSTSNGIIQADNSGMISDPDADGTVVVAGTAPTFHADVPAPAAAAPAPAAAASTFDADSDACAPSPATMTSRLDNDVSSSETEAEGPAKERSQKRQRGQMPIPLDIIQQHISPLVVTKVHRIPFKRSWKLECSSEGDTLIVSRSQQFYFVKHQDTKKELCCFSKDKQSDQWKNVSKQSRYDEEKMLSSSSTCNKKRSLAQSHRNAKKKRTTAAMKYANKQDILLSPPEGASNTWKAEDLLVKLRQENPKCQLLSDYKEVILFVISSNIFF